VLFICPIMATPLWGLDLGGTKIEGVILESKEHPRPLARMRVPTEANLGYQHVIGQVEKLVNMLSAESGLKPASIGLGHPGALDPITGVMKNANTVCLIGQPFDKDLSARLGIPVKLANDANCFAVAETHMGIVPDVCPNADVVFGIIMGTGVGGGVVVRGKVINGRMGIGGEWGHNFLDESGGMCYCGRLGCVETVFAGPSLERYYAALSGQSLKLPDIVQRTDTDPHAEATMQRLFATFGRAVAYVINILDPDVIVIGGGVGNIDRLYTEGVEAAKPYVFNTRLDTIFAKPKLGDSAGVFGAAFL
jgi:fructokinase